MIIEMIIEILVIGILLFIMFYLIPKILGVFEPLLKKSIPLKKLNDKEAEWIADYFHNNENAPDEDGYVGNYYLPEEVMVKYREKYGKEREWSD